MSYGVIIDFPYPRCSNPRLLDDTWYNSYICATGCYVFSNGLHLRKSEFIIRVLL
ncbi:MAG: hypothetical protein QXT13_11700 [Pyrobaculum sp.]